MVRAGRHDEYAEADFAERVVSVGWRGVEDLAEYPYRTMIESLVRASYPAVVAETVEEYTAQLYAFRSLMKVGDLVLLLRSNAPELALGVVRGDYEYRSNLSGRHTRAVDWVRLKLRRTDIDPDLPSPPALSAVHRVSRARIIARLRELAGSPEPGPPDAEPESEPPPNAGAPTAHGGLLRNLDYARNLTTAGSHLQDLGVTSFEVLDVYRAAWVQAVAALDHWVRQEIRDRMLALSEKPADPRPTRYRRFNLSLGDFEEMGAGRLTLRQALERQLHAEFGFATFQSPEKIRDGLGHVADINDLWGRVAAVLNERAGNTTPLSGKDVQDRLREITQRRNKIAHEYDEDPDRPPAKRPIDAATTMQAIEWIDRLAAAIVLVLDRDETPDP